MSSAAGSSQPTDRARVSQPRPVDRATVQAWRRGATQGALAIARGYPASCFASGAVGRGGKRGRSAGTQSLQDERGGKRGRGGDGGSVEVIVQLQPESPQVSAIQEEEGSVGSAARGKARGRGNSIRRRQRREKLAEEHACRKSPTERLDEATGVSAVQPDLGADPRQCVGQPCEPLNADRAGRPSLQSESSLSLKADVQELNLNSDPASSQSSVHGAPQTPRSDGKRRVSVNCDSPVTDSQQPPHLLHDHVRYNFEEHPGGEQEGGETQRQMTTVFKWWDAGHEEPSGVHRGPAGPLGEKLRASGVTTQLSCGIVRSAIARDHLWQLANNDAGTWVLQWAIESWSSSSQEGRAVTDMFKMFSGDHDDPLRTLLLDACESRHANFLLQKCIEKRPFQSMRFAVDKLAEIVPGTSATPRILRVLAVALHKFGCRVLERLIRHGSHDLGMQALMCDLVRGENLRRLVRHQFGNHIVQNILEHGHGVPGARGDIAEYLLGDIEKFSRHRVASHVVEKAIFHCGPSHQERLCREILVRREALLVPVRQHFNYSSHVVKTAQSFKKVYLS